MPETVEIDGRIFTRVCGYQIQGLVMTFPCCKEPNHKDDHAFAAYYADYFMEGDTGAIYEARR